MVSPTTQISELNYHIRKKQTEVDHLKQFLARRKKSGLLTEETEIDVRGQMDELDGEITELQRKVRNLENQEVRRSNMQV